MPNDSFKIKQGRLIKYTGSEKVIRIPNNVTKINPKVFENSNIEKVILPDGLERIGLRAFKGTSLKEIQIPDSVQYIDEQAFFECNELSGNITLPLHLKNLGKGSFSKTAISGVFFHPDLNAPKIGDYAFCGCRNLNTISFPADYYVQSIGKQAFSYTPITHISIKAKRVEEKAFSNCFNLYSVNIEDTDYIDPSAFNFSININYLNFDASTLLKTQADFISSFKSLKTFLCEKFRIAKNDKGLWQVDENTSSGSKYLDLTNTINAITPKSVFCSEKEFTDFWKKVINYIELMEYPL